MKVIDAHCDVLWQMWKRKYVHRWDLQRPFYHDADWLQVTFQKLQKGGIGLQACAIYVDEQFAHSRAFEVAVEMIDLFYSEVLSEQTILIRNIEDVEEWKKGNRLGLILTLEGAEALERDLVKLRTLHRLGVRWVGLTHNPANAAADGVGEERGGGLTKFGRELVAELNRLQMGIDVSHLSERGFWEVIERSSQPVFATHSNAKAVYSHRRNLTDEQIKAIIQKQGMIGITFVPYFTAGNTHVTISDLIRHIDHILSLGGEDHIGFGSDFDGIEETILGLENASHMEHLLNELYKRYPAQTVEKMKSTNWLALLERLWC